MEFKKIDQADYGKRLKVMFFAITVFMLAVALATSQLLILFFGGPEGENFWLNLAGVVVAAVLLSQVLVRIKHKPFMEDIVYVRDLKAQLNQIHRKSRKIKAAAQEGDARAMAILDFSYRASRYVFELDNNTITLEDLTRYQNELQALQEQHGIEQLPEYRENWLETY